MLDEDGTQYCFRCKGLAVIEKRSLTGLVETMGRACQFLDLISMDADVVAAQQIEAEKLANKFRDYAILIESLPDD
jgi:hypothetical protein